MKFFFTILLSLVLGTAASALDLALAAGTLSSRLTPAEASSETVLRLSGTMDASDFYFIDKHMPSLAVLDLSKVSIVGYKGEPINGISTFPADMIPPSALAGKQITELILPAAGSVSVGDFAFASTAISTLDLRESVKSVGMGAFSACKSLVRVSGKGAGIGDFAFSGCTSLAEVWLGGVTSLGASAFDGCSSLSGVGGCGELTEIGNRAFAGTQALKEFTFSEKLRSIGSEAFLASAIETVRLDECVALRSIGDWAFACNGSLITATVPENVSAIGNGVFFACPALVSLSLPVSLAEIGDYALKGTSLTELVLPSSTAYIGSHAMHGMESLSAIDARSLDDVPALGSDVWEGVDPSAVVLSVKSNMADSFRSAGQWQDFDIRGVQTDSATPTVMTSTGVQGRFSGSDLLLRSSGQDMSLVEIYDAAGSLLLRQNVSGNNAVVNTSGIQAPLMLVRCLLADGAVATIKIIRTNG